MFFASQWKLCVLCWVRQWVSVTLQKHQGWQLRLRVRVKEWSSWRHTSKISLIGWSMTMTNARTECHTQRRGGGATMTAWNVAEGDSLVLRHEITVSHVKSRENVIATQQSSFPHSSYKAAENINGNRAIKHQINWIDCVPRDTLKNKTFILVKTR